MRVIESIVEMKEIIKSYRCKGLEIGFVPTMGYLHEGHASLIRMSIQDNDITIVSIFVNPKQFGQNEDYARYPRDIKRDVQIAGDEGVDIIFAPSIEQMYPEGFKTSVGVRGLTDNLCGRYRPGHFEGVCTVVCKFLNVIKPDMAYFGQKDAQQAVVIKRMVNDLNMDAEIAVCPIVREKDGLAMSSRNKYLNTDERKASLLLSRSLFAADKAIKEGERDALNIRQLIKETLETSELIKPEYIETLKADSLESIQTLEGKVLVAIAAYVGNTRLIDNIITEVD